MILNKIVIVPIVFISCFLFTQAQKKDQIILDNQVVVSKDIEIDSISVTKNLGRSPLKASLYSAILPGLGQLYNKKYIKAPIALGLVGTGVGFIKYYDNRYKRYHKAYLAELSKLPHEYSGIAGMTPQVLANAEDSERRNRDYAIVLTSLIYLLNVVDAAVDAHLSIFDIDKDLAIKPIIIEDPVSMVNNQKMGLSFSFAF